MFGPLARPAIDRLWARHNIRKIKLVTDTGLHFKVSVNFQQSLFEDVNVIEKNASINCRKVNDLNI